MQDDQDRPLSETDATPKVPRGENVKDLVTPGGDADEEADAEQTAPPGGEMPGADETEANPKPGEAPEEEQSPT